MERFSNRSGGVLNNFVQWVSRKISMGVPQQDSNRKSTWSA